MLFLFDGECFNAETQTDRLLVLLHSMLVRRGFTSIILMEIGTINGTVSDRCLSTEKGIKRVNATKADVSTVASVSLCVKRRTCFENVFAVLVVYAAKRIMRVPLRHGPSIFAPIYCDKVLQLVLRPTKDRSETVNDVEGGKR